MGEAPEMLERVARALFKTEWDNKGHSWEMEAAHHAYWREQARAAIAAMREPTEDMCMIGEDLGEVHAAAAQIWRAMIDAALK